MAGVANDILVVEDDGLQREALTVLLEGEGYGVVTATDGCEALVQLRARPGFCLILLDMMMPVMDGWQFRTSACGSSPRRARPAGAHAGGTRTPVSVGACACGAAAA